ncbi:exonuclease domain-containing protein [Aquiluna sp. KACHI24]|uniref:exonuclease domain-containing protein n=1 Tax=Aquiluna sp. KACHI24 TaxID=2968831 RepID=UPI0022327076|nr:exonuclease domain-containing protein [Aquiluna sp. KACHI24]
MGELDFVVVDFETTGLHADAMPIEIGMVKVTDGAVTDTFQSLVHQNWVSPEATNIHGLSVADLELAPSASDLVDQFAKFISDLPLVMHNAAFDLRIAKASGLSRSLFANKVYCSLHLSRATVNAPNHKLATLAETLNLNQSPEHRALADALTTAELVLALLNERRFKSLHNLYVTSGLWPGQVGPEGYKLPKNGSKQSAHMTASIRESIAASITDDEWAPHPEWIGREVCFTGTLESMDRSEAHRWAMRLGAEPRMSLNKKTQFVIVGGNRGSSKLDKLQEWRSKGSTIVEIDEEQFLGFIEEAQHHKGLAEEGV